MALPSILLLLAFVGGVAATLVGIMVELKLDLPDQVDAAIGAGIGLVAAGAAWLHWRRFMVPITVAAGAVALAGVAVGVTLAAVHRGEGGDLSDRAGLRRRRCSRSPCGGTCPTASAARAARMSPSGSTSPPRR